MGDHESKETVLQRKNMLIRISEQEVLMMLRAYQAHASPWAAIIQTMRLNAHMLPDDARDMYRTAGMKQIKDRLCGMLNKLMSMDMSKIKSEDVRKQIRKVHDKELMLVGAATTYDGNKRLTEQTNYDKSRPHCTNSVSAKRDKIAADLSDDEEDVTHQQSANDAEANGDEHQAAVGGANQQEVDHAKPPKKKKRISTFDLIRKNQITYNKFITKKIPKLLKKLGVSSSSESDESD